VIGVTALVLGTTPHVSSLNESLDVKTVIETGIFISAFLINPL